MEVQAALDQIEARRQGVLTNLFSIPWPKVDAQAVTGPDGAFTLPAHRDRAYYVMAACTNRTEETTEVFRWLTRLASPTQASLILNERNLFWP